jgi:anti-sigma factor RsiW
VSGAGGCAQIRPELGVYVLGAITQAGREVVGRHLMSCPRCRDEVAGLAGIPAMLRRVPAAAAAGWVPQLLHAAAPPLQAAAAWWTAAPSGCDPATGAGATVRYAPEPWGTELETAITGIALPGVVARQGMTGGHGCAPGREAWLVQEQVSGAGNPL